ncbi:MAG: type II toxin-antitoxin system Phd/YefM family antitoxin [Gammaproteobacteria bacterium]|nr:type II toxin-antitoxin system Phd/YefM family antitoxin [Gammaproteobacteria bacterium]
MATIDASDFKARCLAILDRVQATGERIVILKAGRPMAELRPLTRAETGCPQSELRGTVTILGDVIAPAVPPDHWESVGE